MARGRKRAPPTLTTRLLQLPLLELLADRPSVALEPLPSRYECRGEYRLALQGVVLEEARFMLADAAHNARLGSGALLEALETDEDADAPLPPLTAEPARALFRVRRTDELRSPRPGESYLLVLSPPGRASERTGGGLQRTWRVGIVDSSARGNAPGKVHLLLSSRLHARVAGLQKAFGGGGGAGLEASSACAAGSVWEALPLASVLSCQRMWSACEFLPRLKFESELLGAPPAQHTRFTDSGDEDSGHSDGGSGSDEEELEAAATAGVSPTVPKTTPCWLCHDQNLCLQVLDVVFI